MPPKRTALDAADRDVPRTDKAARFRGNNAHDDEDKNDHNDALNDDDDVVDDDGDRPVGPLGDGVAFASDAESDGRDEVDLPPVWVLKRKHVAAALSKAVCDDLLDRDGRVTLWIHAVTVGIERDCFSDTSCVSRVLVRQGRQDDKDSMPPVAAATLRLLVGKLMAYEPDIVDLIRELAMSDFDYMRRVGDGAFMGCEEIEEVQLPRSVTHIGRSAFESCNRQLTSITLPDSLTHIGERSFLHCHRLTKVNFPESLTHIGESAFERCAGLKSVTLPESVVTVGEGAFQFCSDITTVTLPGSFMHVSTRMFNLCTKLMSVTLSDSLVSVGDGAFSGCSTLSIIKLPDTVTHISNDAFKFCMRFRPTTMKLPRSLTHIGNGAFYGCSGLTAVNLPDTIIYIGDSAFEHCDEMRLTSVKLPKTLVHVGARAFSDVPLSFTTRMALSRWPRASEKSKVPWNPPNFLF